MKLIKKLDRRLSGSKKYIVRWGLFLCPYCNKKNEKTYQNGLRNKSCGCMKNNFITTHGESHLNRSRLYYIWSSMKQRCLNKKNKAYKNYGGRGISICDEWIKSYLSFKKWALLSGYKNNLTLDRTNNNGNYEPCNCKWVTMTEQCHNKRTNKLNWITVKLIRTMFSDGWDRKELHNIFYISKVHLNRILRNEQWREGECYGN